MAQGNKKLAKKNKKAQQKPGQMKKGARFIAPKKANVIKAQKTKKVYFVGYNLLLTSYVRQSLEKAINANIEQQVAGRAKANDQNLKIVNIQISEAKRPTTGQIIKKANKKQAEEQRKEIS